MSGWEISIDRKRIYDFGWKNFKDREFGRLLVGSRYMMV
jgi:hypothetical protein